jgi:hypothetical protein
MNQNTNIPLTLAISLSVLTGWLVSEFRMNDAVETALVPIPRVASMEPAMSTPNIDTNWFTGTNGPSVSYQFPSSQAKRVDDDEGATVGGTMGEGFGNNDDY